jgi:hypothetical protein
MTKDNPECEACAAMVRVFGDRFPNGCSSISDGMIETAMKGMIDTVKELQDEIDAKKLAGTISKEDYEALTRVFNAALPFAASSMPAAALAVGANVDPGQMMQLVQSGIQIWMQQKLTELMERDGPDALVKMLAQLGGMPSEPENDEPENDEPEGPSDPTVN